MSKPQQIHAIGVKATSTGLPPVLQPCQYSKDHEGMYHFCNPNGLVFAVGGLRSKSGIYVEEDKKGISIRGGVITHAGRTSQIIEENKWTVVEGTWKKVN